MADRLTQIVLVHGASHGGWCWEVVAPMLRDMGYKVETPDLPGLGDDQTPLEGITIQCYIDRVVETVKAINEPVLLLGHSMGCSVVAGAAEVVPDRIGKLVFLAGPMPKDGESTFSGRDLLAQFKGPSAIDAMKPHPTIPNAVDFDSSMADKIFYNTCPPEIIPKLVARLRPQPVAPMAAPLHLTDARYGKVRKVYIVCEADHTFPAGAQHWQCDRMPEAKKYTLPTDHSPFYSDPKGLVAIIDAEART